MPPFSFDLGIERRILLQTCCLAEHKKVDRMLIHLVVAELEYLEPGIE